MAWIVPKLDWGEDDSINAADFNRIESNLATVAAYLNSIQYTMPAMTMVTNRSKTSLLFLSDINRIESNLETIRSYFITPAGFDPGKTWSRGFGFDYKDAIRLESNLKLLYELGLLAYDNLRYCGTQTCGEWGPIY
ncbi:hypothetical protein [Paenibacillus methanolicus]|uniref:Uncharacterized protein n=1 Tax=Paenibacillus methanolicus TaxID=582686 RepID=A0A5S5BQ84_9BACL|nr:hypothetical protein [Paenibacillus methanolicus]TYP67703.1 hypothetical protein BCM02_12328 [Paenibacillus methanolicus]